MVKELNGAELSGYMKLNQAHLARSLKARKIQPKLVIIRDSDNPVIDKYVHLKQHYGDDIGVVVEDWFSNNISDIIKKANADPTVHGIIVQLPLKDPSALPEVEKIAPAKDVDGLGPNSDFDSATATAINWLLAGYNIELDKYRIALVGHGRLVGGPLEKMWQNSGYDVTVFDHSSNLEDLKDYDLIVSATGAPHLIKDCMVKPGAILVDAGTASEGGVLVGDLSDEVRARIDLTAITPKIGGVGPLTVTALFEHVLIAAEKVK